MANSSSSTSRGPCVPKDAATVLVSRALAPTSHVDFPQITEICDRVEAYPHEATDTVKHLLDALRQRSCPPHQKLKALTILNEMMYNEDIVACVNGTPGAQEVLMELRRTKDVGAGEVMEENIRMLATEIEKQCSSAPSKKSSGMQLSSAGKEGLDWLNRSAMDKFQKARSLEKAFQNSEFHGFLAKMERNLERKVHSAMGWQLPAGQDSNRAAGPPFKTSSKKQQPELIEGGSRTGGGCIAVAKKAHQQLTEEELQLQWAIRLSLEQQSRAAQSPASSPSPQQTNGTNVARVLGVDETLLRSLGETEARERAVADEVIQLRRQLIDSRLVITNLSEQQEELENELQQLSGIEARKARELSIALQGLKTAVRELAAPSLQSSQDV